MKDIPTDTVKYRTKLPSLKNKRLKSNYKSAKNDSRMPSTFFTSIEKGYDHKKVSF